ncbi:DHA2 family efflux MFS transporter permease subunit [Fodinicola acaciae]|uniref:DHA2 family efflux MFS transporter permease subunit n=1 Tax=Fodinicola acaciae TaxID=2681555 RepID=UPI0013D2201D|nr:DHA2 family efflux MFS transporter permease subunit [Fodinicola acaciae]
MTTVTRVPAAVWRVAAVIILGSFMSNLGSSLVNVGLTTISRDLAAPLATTQWLASGYLVAFAAALPLTAWLGRRMGAGRLWLYALAAFTVSSVLCALAPTIAVLIALRLLQGLAGAMLVPTGHTIIGQLAGADRMGRVLNSTKVVSVLAPVIGPAVGGLLVSGVTWRSLFLVNAPVGLVALLFGLRLVPRGAPAAGRPLDVTGLALAAIGVPLVVYGITATGQHRGDVTFTLALGAVGVVALALFVWRSLRVPVPVLNLRLFGNPAYTAAIASVFFTGAALLGTMVLLPLYYQLIRHESVVQTGLLMLAVGSGAALSMPFGGALTDRIGGGIVSVAGLAVSLVTVLPLAFAPAGVSLVLVEALQVGTGFGLGLSAMPALSAAYKTVPVDQLPEATSEANILQRVGGSVGTAALVVALERGGSPTVDTFRDASRLLVAAVVLALAFAIWLTVEERRRAKRSGTNASRPRPGRLSPSRPPRR